MTAPGNDPVFLALALSFFVTSAYALGRIHQWHKHGRQRDDAYRQGYDKASQSILDMMARPSPAGAGVPATDRLELYPRRYEEGDRAAV
jgi:hypothetical protein